MRYKTVIFTIFTFAFLSCEDNIQLFNPVLDSNCEIECMDDSIKIAIDDNQYTLLLKDDEYIFNGVDDAVALSNSRIKCFRTKKYTSIIRSVSANQFYSTIYANNNAIVIYYDSCYNITKIKAGGYVKFGNVEDVSLSFKLDSALQERMCVYDFD